MREELLAAGCPAELHDQAVAAGLDLATLLQLWNEIKTLGAAAAPLLRILAGFLPAPIAGVVTTILTILFPNS
jgi:hypothetical protein